MNYSILSAYGIDYKKGIMRCASSPELYEKLLTLFLEDDSFQRAFEAYHAADRKTLYSCVHEMKGSCGNAGLTKLFETASSLVEILRDPDNEGEDISFFFGQMEKAYHATKEGVEKAML